MYDTVMWSYGKRGSSIILETDSLSESSTRSKKHLTCSAAVESLFSTTGLMLNDKRSS